MMSRIGSFLAITLFVFAPLTSRAAGNQPTVEVTRPNYRYAISSSSLQAIDFPNFRFIIFDQHKQPILKAKLHQNKFESRWTFPTGSDWVRLDWIKFLQDDGRYAIASLSWVTTGASASDFGVVQVIGLRDHHPTVLQQILFNAKGCGAEPKLDKTGILLVRGVHGWDNCCSKTLDVIRYRWIGASFTQVLTKSAPLPNNC